MPLLDRPCLVRWLGPVTAPALLSLVLGALGQDELGGGGLHAPLFLQLLLFDRWLEQPKQSSTYAMGNYYLSNSATVKKR